MSEHMYSFETNRDAVDFVRERVDAPMADTSISLGDGMVLHAFCQELGEGAFTNVYDLSFPAGAIRPAIAVQDKLTSVFDHVASHADIRAATGGGFFFLADQASAMPRQLALNLALVDGRLRSFPVRDSEAVLTDGERLAAEHIKALGTLAIGDTELSWSGSLTHHETDIKVFGNGNSVIRHVQNDTTGSMRILNEKSRYTPVIDDDDMVDIGLIRRDDGVFVGVNRSVSGGLDIFSHDVVMRTHERYAHGALPEVRICTLDSKALDGTLQGALSVGPMLNTENFIDHPVNGDRSLGNKPPFLDVPLARTVLYETDDGLVHMRLFDGRPGSPIFPGVTPDQAASFIKSERQTAWGCFLDPGQTAKLVVREPNDIASYGNTHYLQWPQQPGDRFVWVPKTSRPTASMIALH